MFLLAGIKSFKGLKLENWHLKTKYFLSINMAHDEPFK